MAVQYQTNGTAGIYVGGQALGLSSSEGVEVAVNEYLENVLSDERGPSIPSEIIRNGSDCKITFELWKYDPAVLNAFMALREGGTQGQMGIIGQLVFANNLTTTLAIDSPNDGVVWTFNRVIPIDDIAVQLSTQLKIWKLTVMAYPDANGYLYTGGG